jgi:putative hemolysin
MKSNKILVVVIMTAVGCLTACKTAEVVPTSEPQIANPASVYCEQNGNRLEIQTAADGSQSGVCIFPDGSTCDEWAYFRGECGPAVLDNPKLTPAVESTIGASGGYMQPGTSEAFSDWWGVIKSTDAGAQYDDYFERQDLGEPIYFGIDSRNADVQAQIEALRDSGKVVHLYGTLLSNVPDYNGSQIVVERIEVDE